MSDSCRNTLRMSDGTEWSANTCTGSSPHVEVFTSYDRLNIAHIQSFKNAGEMRMLGSWLIANADIQDRIEAEFYRRTQQQ